MSRIHKLDPKSYYSTPPDRSEQASDFERQDFPWWVPGQQWVSIGWFGGVHVITRRKRI
jgi:hypothetical protein